MAPEAVYDGLAEGLPVMTALNDGVLLFVEELVKVKETLGVTDTDFVGLIADAEAQIVKEVVGDPVEVRLALDVNVLLPEPEAVLEEVIDDVCVFVDAAERVVDGDDEVVLVDVIERD